MDLRALGVDCGTRHCGVAIVGTGDALLHHTVLTMRGHQPAERILCAKLALAVIVQHWQPTVISVERFTYEGHDTTQHEYMCWMVGACLDLGTLVTPHAAVCLYTVSEWRHQLIGRQGRVRGDYGKQAAAAVLALRLGHRFRESGLHAMDAAGLALAALDTYQRTALACQGRP